MLFDGGCGAEDYFEGSTSGDDMSLIADLGTVPLEEVTSSKAFNYSKFAEGVKVIPKHTYAVLINKMRLRGLFVITVDSYVPNQRVDLRYAVKEYQVLTVRAASEGFDWKAKNSAPSDEK